MDLRSILLHGILYVEICDDVLMKPVSLQRVNSALDIVCRVKHNTHITSEMLIQIHTASICVAVYSFFILMDKQNVIFPCKLNHPLKPSKHLIAIFFRLLSLRNIEAEHANPAAL